MRGAVLYGPRDVRFEERETPKIVKPPDAIIRISATCVCGSDLWPYRGIQPIAQPTPMGHEYCGIVEEVGSAVTSIKPGQFVIGSFFASDNSCPNCQIGYQSSCQHAEFVGTAQAPLLRVPLADGTLVTTPDVPSGEMVPEALETSLLGVFASGDCRSGTTKRVAFAIGDGALAVTCVHNLLGTYATRRLDALNERSVDRSDESH
jgi:threonine dehydrogenase-like Zn-dependent dehydrogenase